MRPFVCHFPALAYQCLPALCSPDAKIDVHAHFLPDFYRQALQDAGHVPGPDGMPGIPAWSLESQLSFMKNNSIDKVYLSVSSPGVYLTLPSRIATQNATRLARQVNQYASRLKAQHPDQIGFFAALPLPDIQAALAEIDYAFHVLDPKPDGVGLLSNYYGMYLGDPALDPVYAALDGVGATVFEHPTTPCTQLGAEAFRTDGEHVSVVTPKEWAVLNRPLAVRQFAAPTLDFPFESARVFADLLYGQIPSRFPGLRWIIPHAGGALLDTLDRVNSYSSLYPGLNLTASGVQATLARSFYFDLAGPRPVASAISSLLRWVDHTRILFGTDTPFTPWAGGTAATSAFDAGVDAACGHDAAKVYAVRRGNAEGLFEA